MPELTRDEAKRVCEAVHWNTTETGGGFMVSTPFGWCGWKALRRVEVAMALLEEWRQVDPDDDDFEYGIDRGDDKDGRLVYAVTLRERWPSEPIPRTLARHDDPFFPEAALRAVLAWKEARDD
jgi:hypothetical protein